jgi:hypothetical protein
MVSASAMPFGFACPVLVLGVVDADGTIRVAEGPLEKIRVSFDRDGNPGIHDSFPQLRGRQPKRRPVQPVRQVEAGSRTHEQTMLRLRKGVATR